MSSDQRSPTRSSAASRALGPASRPSRCSVSSAPDAYPMGLRPVAMVVCCDLQVTTSTSRRAVRRPDGGTAPMSALDELSSAIRASIACRRPGRRRDRPRSPWQRRRRRRRPRPDQRPQPARRRGHRHASATAGRASAPSRGVDSDGDLAVVEVDTDRRHGRRLVRRGAAASATSSSRLPRPASGAARVTFGFVSAVERTFRGPGGSRIGGSARAHRAARAGLVRRPARRRRAARSSAINTNRVGEGFYLARPADAALRERVDALGRGESVEPAATRHRRRAVARRPAPARARSA